MPDRKKSIQGNWNFALTVKSVDSKERTIGGISEKEGIKANMEKVAIRQFHLFFITIKRFLRARGKNGIV